MKRHEVTDKQWELIAPLIPGRKALTGRPPKDPRLMLDGILWVLGTGAPWRDLPERFGSCKTVHRYFSTWRRDGVFARILEALQIKLDEKGLLDWDLWCVDGANVRAARAAAGADKKASSGTPTSPKTTRWAAAAAGLDRSSTWLPTARALRSPWRSAPARCMNRPAPSRSSVRPSRRGSARGGGGEGGVGSPANSRATGATAPSGCAPGCSEGGSSR